MRSGDDRIQGAWQDRGVVALGPREEYAHAGPR
jgi:hypothetical protein